MPRRNYLIRKCRKTCVCIGCKKEIVRGRRYRDGGSKYKYHKECYLQQVKADKITPPVALTRKTRCPILLAAWIIRFGCSDGISLDKNKNLMCNSTCEWFSDRTGGCLIKYTDKQI